MGKKTVANKKRPRTSSIGSSSTPRPPPNLIEAHKHKFKEMVATKIFKPNVVFSWPVMRIYGLAPDFQTYFADPAWEQLFSINEKTYRGVTLEVLSSFKIAFPYPVNGLHNEVSFSAFGQYYHLPMLQFCAYTGLYTDEQMQEDDFQHLKNSWGQLNAMDDFWNSISTKGPYNSSASRGTHLQKTSARILHWLLVHSLNGRINSTSVMSQQDLFAMYSMMTGTRVNVAIQLAFAIRHQTKVSNHGVFCGAFITRILKNMGIFPSEEPGDVACISFSMTSRTMVQWGIPKVSTSEEDPIQSIGHEDNTSVSSLQQLTMEMKSLKKQQDKILRRQKGLKQFMVSSFKAIAEKLKVKLPDCISSSSGDEYDEIERFSPIHDLGASGVAAPVDEEFADINQQFDDYEAPQEGDGAQEGGIESLEYGSETDDACTRISRVYTRKPRV